MTGSLTNSDSSNTIFVAFMVNAEWTDPLSFFDGSDIGLVIISNLSICHYLYFLVTSLFTIQNACIHRDIEEVTYGLAGAPTEIAITIDGSNAWGFDYFSVEISGETYILSCEDDQSGMSSTSEHWLVNVFLFILIVFF